MPPFRLLIDRPAPGAWNMAVDQALLEWSSDTGDCCWRFYGWDVPTLSLGYFQAYADRKGHAASLACPAVRRASGGGAILHDRELTYSLVVPRSHPLLRRPRLLYETIHQTLIAALGRWSIGAELCDDETAEAEGAKRFLCFQRREPGDVLVDGVKIAGSAQRRSRSSVLQHGSVLLAQSAAAPELPGLAEVTGVSIGSQELVAVWMEELARRLAPIWEEKPLTDGQRQRAEAVVADRFGADRWTIWRGRSEPRQGSAT